MLKFGLYIIFTYHEIIILLLIFSQPFKNVKNFLSSQAIKNRWLAELG